jgi:tripartite-type tricarboxylate transporter receptor subunit TctC
MRRREVLGGLALGGSALAGMMARPALAAWAPTRDIDIIIPYSPGGGFDAYIRAMLPALQKQLPSGVSAVPDNVPGAGGSKALAELFHARIDGSTIGVLNVPGVLIMQEQGGLPVDPGKLTWLCNMGTDVYGLAVAAKSDIHSVADLQALSKQRPIKFTEVGPASASYAATMIGCELLGMRPQLISGYRGTSDYIVAVVRGDGDACLASLTVLQQFRRSGLIRILATFEEHSSVPGAEDATTLHQKELTEVVQLRPLAGPPRLPAEVAGGLSAMLLAALHDPAVQDWASKNDANLTPDGAEATLKLLEEQTAFVRKWKKYLTVT